MGIWRSSTRHVRTRRPPTRILPRIARGRATCLFWQVPVDAYLRVVGAEDAIALGDAAERVGEPLPETAQADTREIRARSREIARDRTG